MMHRFAFTVTQDETELCLVGPDGPLPVDRRPAEAPASLRPGVDLAQRLEAADSATPVDTTLFIKHASVAGLTAHEASLLGLPPAGDAVAMIGTKGIVTQPDYEVTLCWQRPTGQAIAGAKRTGAWLEIGDRWHRLPDPLFSLAEAVEEAQQAGRDAGARLTAMAHLLELLPEAQQDGSARATGMLCNTTVHVADAFSLDLDGDGENARLVPVLHRAGGDPAAPLLPEPLHDAFAHRQFNSFNDSRTVYTLGDGNMLVLSPPLRRALSVVGRLQSAAPATRRDLFTNPRAYLCDALGDEAETLVEHVFRDTKAYSERVIGLGLWQPRVVPWVRVAATDWFAGDTEASAVGPAGTSRVPGLLIGDEGVELTPSEADDLRERIERAISAGEPTVDLCRPEGPLPIPATHETLGALARLEAVRRQPVAGDPPAPRAPAEVLLIHPNEETLVVEALVSRRRAPAIGTPTALVTPPMGHQSEGLAWLQKAWAEGLPGVLLADDMGLGKTLQGLAFLAWLRQGMAEGIIPREPVLIVAPTGLLANWEKEHTDHLAAPGLGERVAAYGQGLRSCAKVR
jgi:SNF2 domain-containing protein